MNTGKWNTSLPSPAPGPGSSHLSALSHQGPDLHDPAPLEKEEEATRRATSHGVTSTPRVQAGNVPERSAQKAPAGWSLEMGTAPTPSCPSCPLPTPPCCPEPHPHIPRLRCRSGLCPLAPLGVWPFSGLCLPPRAGETHSSLCHFPSWAAKGPGPQPPAPSLCSLCLFSFPPRHPPPRTPTQLPH